MATSESVAIKGRNKARIMTESVLLAHEDILSITSSYAAKTYFGATSEEYSAAEAFFTAVGNAKSMCKTLQFAPCGHEHGDKKFTKYTVTAKKNSVTCVNDENGVETTYDNIVALFRDIPDYSNMTVTLAEDIVFVSEETKADTTRDFTDATATTDSDLLHGIVVRDTVKAIVDLKGKQLSFDVHVFTNNGNLIIRDTSLSGDGRCYTTNFAITIDGVKHTDSSWDVGAAECIINKGNLRIEGGWFGTNVASMKPRVNDVNWGVCLQNGKHGFTHILGGYFTNVTFQKGAKALQKWVNMQTGTEDNSFLCDFNGEKLGAAKDPYAYIFEMHYGGRMLMEGGTLFGCANGGIGIIGDYTMVDDVMKSTETTEDDYDAFTMTGGEIVNGFKGYSLPSDAGLKQFNSFVFAGGNSTYHNSTTAHNDQQNTLPSGVLPYCYSRAYIKSGVLTDSFTSRKDTVLSGKVKCDYGVTLDNCTVENEFKDLELTIGEPVRRIELWESLSDTHYADDEFYNCTFLHDVKASELEELHAEVADENYMHNVVCRVEGLEDGIALPEIGGGIGVTTDRDASFATCAITSALPIQINV